MSRRHGVDADVTEGLQGTARGEPDESPEAASRDILEEDPLDGILRAEAQDLVV